MRRHALAIVAIHAVVLAFAIYLVAYRLPLYADFSYLLPQDAPAVKDLRALEARVKTTDTVLVVLTAPDPTTRAEAARETATGLRALPPQLVEQVDENDADLRRFLSDHRWLFVPPDDLVRARDALAERIKSAKLAANPLYVDLDDDTAADIAKQRKQLDDLRAKRKDAEAKLDHPFNVSKDGLIEMLQVRTGFRPTDAARGEELLAAMARVRAAVISAHPGVDIGFTGGVVSAIGEHRAISKGILLSTLITGLLVALVLAFYFRSATMLALLVGTIGVATAAAFGAAVFTVGHLNAATAFLGAIIAGNGINYGILLIARYLEERGTRGVEESLGTAILGTLRPTAVASLGASIAYGSLAATSFKGFADFAVIGAVGMMLCWIATYTLLPALLLQFGRDTRIHDGEPLVGGTLVRVLGFRRSRVVLAVAAGIGIAAAAVVVKFVASDPFEYDIKELRSKGEDAITARRWMKLSDDTFGRGYAGRTIIAADRLDQVPSIVDALHALDAGVPPERQTVGPVVSILDIVPPDQPKRLALLADIRAELDDPALAGLDDKERAELAELRPPAELAPITIDSLPASFKQQFAEKDGRIGLLVSLRPANKLDEWNGHDLIRFATAIRELHLKGGEVVTTSGASVIFADIISSIERDGPFVTAIAAVGLVVMVLLLVGRNRRAVAVLLATVGGSLLMVAACALLGLKVNFLDFVALPITLGLGIDYAINVGHRRDDHGNYDPVATLRTSGSAVFVCSLTTMIGYGSLLVSENLAIRGFGTASLIGEIACVMTALVLVPALLAVGNRKVGEPAAEAAAA
ncbi:MAG TPA: MMPL family transporter [Kofleriaceae bacterium]|nr:MMPL family transporter [Kofleriaceae bacterium]